MIGALAKIERSKAKQVVYCSSSVKLELNIGPKTRERKTIESSLLFICRAPFQ